MSIGIVAVDSGEYFAIFQAVLVPISTVAEGFLIDNFLIFVFEFYLTYGTISLDSDLLECIFWFEA